MKEKMIKVPYTRNDRTIRWSSGEPLSVEPIYHTIEVPVSTYNEWVKHGEDVHWNAYAMAFRKDCGIREFDETVIIYD